MSNAQRFGVGLFYAAMAALGAAYAIFEQHQANLLGHAIKEVMPALLILIVVFLIYALFRTRSLKGSMASPEPLTLRSMRITVRSSSD